MIVTLNEVEQWCLRALAGCGAPAGVDEDAAAAASWLVARGFPALDVLTAAIERCDDATAAPQPAPLRQIEGTQRFEAAGRSAVFLAGALIDNAVAAAASSHAAARTVVTALADPLFLLPLAARYRRRGWCFTLRWGSAEARIDGDGPSLWGEASEISAVDAIETTITCGTQPPAHGELPICLSSNDLQARNAETLERGVTVPDRTWAHLKVLGMHALVPASEESRVRGAGSSASDNE